MIRRRLIWRLLLWADALICGLPTPETPRGPYFEEWGDLGDVHSVIGRAYDAAQR